MDPAKVKKAVQEAERFLERAEQLGEAYIARRNGTLPKEHGAVRRASLDLTRALAEMRRPG